MEEPEGQRAEKLALDLQQGRSTVDWTVSAKDAVMESAMAASTAHP